MCQEKPIPTESTGDSSLKRVYLCENMAMALLPRSVRLSGICSAQGWSARGVPGAHTTIPASPEFQDQRHQFGISFYLQQYLDYSPICISQASLTLIILLRYRYNGLTEISDKKSSSPQLIVAGQGSSLYSLGVVSVLTFSFLPILLLSTPHLEQAPASNLHRDKRQTAAGKLISLNVQEHHFLNWHSQLKSCKNTIPAENMEEEEEDVGHK